MGLRGTWDETGHWYFFVPFFFLLLFDFQNRQRGWFLSFYRYNRGAVLTGLNPVQAHVQEPHQSILEGVDKDVSDEKDEKDEDVEKEPRQTFVSSSSSSSSASCSAKNNAFYSDATYPINTNNRKFQYYCRDNTLMSGLHFKASSQASTSVCVQCGPVVPDDPPSVLIRKDSDDVAENKDVTPLQAPSESPAADSMSTVTTMTSNGNTKWNVLFFLFFF